MQYDAAAWSAQRTQLYYGRGAAAPALTACGTCYGAALSVAYYALHISQLYLCNCVTGLVACGCMVLGLYGIRAVHGPWLLHLPVPSAADQLADGMEVGPV